MRTLPLLIAAAGIGLGGVAFSIEPSLAAGPAAPPRTTLTYNYCDTRGPPPQLGERLLQRSYVADCCPRVEERLLYDPKTRRYRTIVVETNERCEAGPSSSERIFSFFPNRAPSPSPTPGPETLETRPGWGYGDDNHIHTGPPGQTGDNPGQGPNGSGPPGQQKK